MQGPEFNPNHLKKGGEREGNRRVLQTLRRLQPTCGQRNQESQARQTVAPPEQGDRAGETSQDEACLSRQGAWQYYGGLVSPNHPCSSTSIDGSLASALPRCGQMVCRSPSLSHLIGISKHGCCYSHAKQPAALQTPHSLLPHGGDCTLLHRLLSVSVSLSKLACTLFNTMGSRSCLSSTLFKYLVLRLTANFLFHSHFLCPWGTTIVLRLCGL